MRTTCNPIDRNGNEYRNATLCDEYFWYSNDKTPGEVDNA